MTRGTKGPYLHKHQCLFLSILYFLCTVGPLTASSANLCRIVPSGTPRIYSHPLPCERLSPLNSLIPCSLPPLCHKQLLSSSLGCCDQQVFLLDLWLW